MKIKQMRLKTNKERLLWTLKLVPLLAGTWMGSQMVTEVKAEELVGSGEDGRIIQLEPLMVIGSVERLGMMPGAGAFLAGSELRDSGNLSFSRIAARVPGVYVREEDGFGNFINVSIRGVDGTRSRKVTLMEDGVLTAPSPYSAPEAYYSPKMGRMAGIEILKGSSQIAYGPHTTGGVVNFLSTPVPGERAFYARTTFGSENTLFNHTTYGDTIATEAGGTFGYLLEFHGQRTDGFRQIDGSSRNTSFTYLEPMVKLFWEPASALPQRIEVKIGYTDFRANETYSGLTEADLRNNPNRRYAASEFDHMDAEQWRTYLRYTVYPSTNLRLESTLYLNRFDRTWDKLDGLRGTGLRTNVAQALLHEPSLAVLQGLGTGEIFTRAAMRDHDAKGWQTRADYSFETGGISHDLSVGLRLHEDSVAGTNQQTFYASNGQGGFGPANPGPVQSAGRSEVFATAVFVEHAMRIGDLTVTPGLRQEWLRWTHVSGADSRATGNEDFTTAGVGLTYVADANNTLFAGLYRGVSTPNPGGYRNGTEHETSTGLELGLRHRRNYLRGELVGFHTDFRNLIAPQVGIGSGGITPSTNAGEARVYGVEAMVDYDAGRAAGWSYGLNLYVSATWTHATFTGLPDNARLGNGAGVFAGAINGSRIPYVPEWKLGTGVALQAERWTTRIDLSYSGKTWGSGYNERPRLDDGAQTLATPTAVDGRIDSLLIVDITGHYELNDNVRLVGGIHNLFDERGIISRLPLGPRANAPRFLFAGAEIRF
ncbi:MAG: TonB-dependent receptor [Verrucomicrobia bacterium]|nr:TonB-dependent receptor [Verrucomicrobiota bacterium]